MNAPMVSNSGTQMPVDLWRTTVLQRLAGGDRFAGLFGSAGADSCRITVLLAAGSGVDALHTMANRDDSGRLSYPCLSDQVPAAFWYERALHDLSGVVPIGHPRLDPLLLPRAGELPAPRPGHPTSADALHPEERLGPVDVQGRGMFMIPFGPVRSGVVESIEYLIETPGEDIPHLNIRPHYKHRGIAKSFEGKTPDDAVLVAERVEGIASVAHALAFCHAIEELAGVVAPPAARLVRVVHAELERIANHLDVLIRLTEAAGLAVANARFGWHKERVLRLVSQLCGSRFGRGVVVPGGVGYLPADPQSVIGQLLSMMRTIKVDTDALMNTASFLDRVRGAGPLDTALATRCGALGPIARGSGFFDDDRWTRGYDAYPELPVPDPISYQAGDAADRLRVRLDEIAGSAALIEAALARLRDVDGLRTAETAAVDGFAVGWAEAPQGEVLYAVELAGNRIVRCLARSASFHNMLLFHDVFHGDIFTDFPFIEASFGLSAAGVAM